MIGGELFIFLDFSVSKLRSLFLKVIHSARANATHNHGLDPDRLLVGKRHVNYEVVLLLFEIILDPLFPLHM